MTGRETWRLGHRPALDGIRALAALLVVVAHAGVGSTAGVIGVNLFFVLSGFLITTLLLQEREESGRIRLGAFYWRRTVRLFPALALTVVGVVLVGWLFGRGDAWITPLSAVGALFYVTDFISVDGVRSALSHTWSLSLEEQFYLTWPLLLLCVVRRGRVVVAMTAVALAVTSALWAAWLVAGHASPERTAWGFDTRVAPVLLGCALGALMHGARVRRVPSALVAVGLAWPFACELLPGPVFLTGGWGLLGACGSVLVVWAAVNSTPRWLEHEWLRWLGVRSYGIYLWHFPAAVFISEVAPGTGSWVRLLLILPLSVAVADLSYSYVEAPLLAFKNLAAPRRGAHVARAEVRLVPRPRREDVADGARPVAAGGRA